MADEKLFLNLEVIVFRFLDLLPNGRSEVRMWPGWCGFGIRHFPSIVPFGIWMEGEGRKQTNVGNLNQYMCNYC